MFARPPDGNQPTDSRRRLAPELLQPVVLARVRREDVHHHVQVVQEDPARLAVALGAARQQPLVRVLQLLVDRVVDRLRLALGVARADHEEVGVGHDPAQVEHADVDRLAVRGDRGDPLGQLAASVCPEVMPAPPSRPARARCTGPVQPVSRRCSSPPCRAPGSGSAALGARGGGSRSTRTRRSAACRRSGSAARAARSPDRDPDRVPRASLARSTTATVASASTFSGSCQPAAPPPGRRPGSGRARRRAPARAAARSVSAVYDGPRRSSSIRDVAKRASSADGQLAPSRAAPRRPGRPAISRCGASPTGMNTTRVQLELHQRLLRADQVADVRRVERPAEDADAQPRYSRTCPEPSTTYL